MLRVILFSLALSPFFYIAVVALLEEPFSGARRHRLWTAFLVICASILFGIAVMKFSKPSRTPADATQDVDTTPEP